MSMWMSRRFFSALVVVLFWTLGRPESAAAQCRQPPGDLQGVWCFVDGAHVRVWWNRTRTSGLDEAKAARIRDEVEARLWPLFFRLLRRAPVSDRDAQRYPSNGGDGRYDIVLTDQIAGRYGESPFVAGSSTALLPARFSKVTPRLPERVLRAKVAHELMHGFLSAFNCVGQCQWLEEATATWAEHYAYPTVNTEHEYTKDYFQDPMVELDSNPSDQDRHKYSAYLFLFFLQHRGRVESAGNPTVVRNIWMATERSADPLAALDATVPGGFARVWREFMTNNWNAEPAAVTVNRRRLPIYFAWDRMKDGVSMRQAPASMPGPRGATLYDVEVPSSTPVPISMNLTLKRLSAAYFVFRFDITVRSVRLTHDIQTGVSGPELVVFTRQGTLDDPTQLGRPNTEEFLS